MHMFVQRRLQIPVAIVMVALLVLSARRTATGAPGAEPKYVARVEPRHVTLPEGNETNPVDRLMKQYWASQLQRVDDRLFARRVYLDTIGLLPTADQVDAFVNNTQPDKRDKLV